MKHIITSNVEQYELRYYMTIHNDIDEENEYYYGIHVTMYENGVAINQEHSGALFADSQKVTDIIMHLAEHTVMPVTLCVILDEMDIWETV